MVRLRVTDTTSLSLYAHYFSVDSFILSSILFRDLKTENVAKNPRSGAMQLFDFGLAKELKATEKVDNDQYHLTGLTGTLRIMSPEVIQCMPYGLGADVYSFAVVTWEVFTGDRNLLTASEVSKGQRPECPVAGMPACLESNLLQPCWRERPDQRPSATQICKELSSYKQMMFHQT
jgi:serine/threonine protein kinase